VEQTAAAMEKAAAVMRGEIEADEIIEKIADPFVFST